jgi:competence protein ComEC
MKLNVFRLAVLAMVAIWLAVAAVPDRRLHVVFCDVGEGDAILITYKTTQILIDGGRGDSVNRCLEKHIPFYDRQIEVVMLTHPEEDHFGGLINVLQSYRVLVFVANSKLENKGSIGQLERLLAEAGVKQVIGKKGDVIRMGRAELKIIWPAEKTDKQGNERGLASRLEFGLLTVGLTADVTGEMLTELGRVKILKIPHHGSKYSSSREWLNQMSPEVAVISVGENSFGHPGKEVLEGLEESGAKVVRTDQGGEAEVISDGRKWWLTRRK